MGLVPVASFDWRADLEASRAVDPRAKGGYEMLWAWFENWELHHGVCLLEA